MLLVHLVNTSIITLMKEEDASFKEGFKVKKESTTISGVNNTKWKDVLEIKKKHDESLAGPVL